jgi:small membrane protein
MIPMDAIAALAVGATAVASGPHGGMIIRILLLAGIAAIGWLVFLRRNRLPFHIVIVFGLLTLGGLAVLFPEYTNDLANYVGVGRGADLITYLLEIVVLFVIVHYYTKFVELQRQLTQVTREVALLRAEIEKIPNRESRAVLKDRPSTDADTWG